MQFPPSGGLGSIKAAPSVKINTRLGGCFSPLPPWKSYCSKEVPARGGLYCRQPDICFVPFALSAECQHLKISFISCCLTRVFLCWYPSAHPSTVQWQWEHWVCPCSHPGVPSHSCLLGLGSSVNARLRSSSFCPCASAFRLHYWQFSLFAWEIWQMPSVSPRCWAHQTTSWDQGGRSLSFLVGCLLRDWYAKHPLSLFCNMCILLQTRAHMILTRPLNTNPFNHFPPHWFPKSICWNYPGSKSPRQPFLFKTWAPFWQKLVWKT